MPRVQGSKGFTNSEIRLVLKEILSILPRSADDWKKVYDNCKAEVTRFNFQHPDRPLSFRKQETLRRKYSDMIALSKKKDNNLIGDKEYMRLCHIASSIHTLCVIRSPEKTNSAITEPEIKKKQQEILLSLQYDNYYNQNNGFGLGDFGLEDESKINLFQLSQQRQFIQQFQRPIQPKLDNSKILSGGKIMESGSYSSGSGKSSPLISNSIDHSGMETNNEGISLSEYQDDLQNKKRSENHSLSPYQMSKRIKYGNTDDSLSMLMQTAINQNNISNSSIPSDMSFLEGGENNIGIREQIRYIMGVVESIHRKVQNIENQLYKVDVIANHLDILESKIYLLSNRNESKIDDKKKKGVSDTLFSNNSSSSKSLSLAKNVFLNKINSSITPNSVSKLVSSSLDTIGVNNIKNPIQLSPKSRGRVQFFEDTFGLKLNLNGKLDPDFNTPASKVSDIILLPETMENIRQFRKDYGNYLTPKSLERINELEERYAKTNALNSEIFKTASALGTTNAISSTTENTSVLAMNENNSKLNTETITNNDDNKIVKVESIDSPNKNNNDNSNDTVNENNDENDNESNNENDNENNNEDGNDNDNENSNDDSNDNDKDDSNEDNGKDINEVSTSINDSSMSIDSKEKIEIDTNKNNEDEVVNNSTSTNDIINGQNLQIID